MPTVSHNHYSRLTGSDERRRWESLGNEGVNTAGESGINGKGDTL